jgi:hypothetical protein
LFAQTIKENRKIVVEIQLLNLHLPGQSICNASVVDLNGKIAAFVKSNGEKQQQQQQQQQCKN